MPSRALRRSTNPSFKKLSPKLVKGAAAAAAEAATAGGDGGGGEGDGSTEQQHWRQDSRTDDETRHICSGSDRAAVQGFFPLPGALAEAPATTASAPEAAYDNKGGTRRQQLHHGGDGGVAGMVTFANVMPN